MMPIPLLFAGTHQCAIPVFPHQFLALSHLRVRRLASQFGSLPPPAKAASEKIHPVARNPEMTNKPKDPVAVQHKRLPVALGGSRENHQKIVREVHDTLQARSALERRRASEIAVLEMELEQHRRLRDTRLMAAVRDLAAGYFTSGRFVIRPDVEQRHLKLARDLVGEDATRQVKAEEKLQAAGTTLDELYARAYQNLAEGLSHHEKRIESLEKRRRDLLDDFDALRVIAPRMRQNG